MDENNDFKKPFIDAFRKQKEGLKNSPEFYRQLLEDASEDDKLSMAQRSPLLEKIDGLVHGDIEYPPTTIETVVATMNEYIKALNEFSEDQFAAFLMGVGVNWLNLPYWGISNLEFQCEKIEEKLATYKKLESNASKDDLLAYEKRNPYRALPLYNASEMLLPSKILKNALSFFKSMLQVLSTRSF
jgi:hypothetical protein